MQDRKRVGSEQAQPATGDDTKVTKRKAYLRPQLRELGDVRGVTLGGSPGAGESGFTTLFKP